MNWIKIAKCHKYILNYLEREYLF